MELCLQPEVDDRAEGPGWAVGRQELETNVSSGGLIGTCCGGGQVNERLGGRVVCDEFDGWRMLSERTVVRVKFVSEGYRYREDE